MNIFMFALICLTLSYGGVDTLHHHTNTAYCYSKDDIKPQVKHFSSKTPYQVIKGTNFHEETVIPHCKAEKIWILSRHGTRLPETYQIKSLPKLEELRDTVASNFRRKPSDALCPEDLDLIKNWKLDKNITKDKSQYLTEQGWNDMKILGQDFKKSFPHLFAEYDPNKFLFRYTDTQRTEASYKAFIEGILGDKAYESVRTIKAPIIDSLLGPYEYCPLWINSLRPKEREETERSKFKDSEAMKRTIERVSSRLGFHKTLKYRHVKQLWDICRFETAWYLDRPSAWCAALTPQDILVFEYLDDLGKQIASGYTNDYTPTIPCEIIQNMLVHLLSEDEPKVAAYFSHSALIQLFATGMGMQKDDHLLKSENFEKESNRKWRTSEIDPFAANFAAVKYNCSEHPTDFSPKIKFFANQKLIDMEGCRNGFCSLSDFIQNYQKYLNANCQRIFCTRNEF